MDTALLLIDDDLAVGRLLIPAVEEMGLDFSQATDGEEGLERALTEPFSVVLIDWRLPKLDGLEVCRRLRAQRPELILIMLTAKNDEIDRVVGLEVGADDYVSKPFSVRELVARIRAVERRTVRSRAPGDDHELLVRGA